MPICTPVWQLPFVSIVSILFYWKLPEAGSFFADDEELSILDSIGAWGLVYRLVLLALLAAALWTGYQMWSGRRRYTWAAMAVYIVLAVIFVGSSLAVWVRAEEMAVRPTFWCVLAVFLMAGSWVLYTRYALPATEYVPLHQLIGVLTGRDFGSLDAALTSVREKGGELLSHGKQALSAMGAPKTWVCPSCGAEMTGEKKFCTACGSKRPVPQRCANCGKLQEPGVAFCSECGARFVPQRQCEKCGTPYLMSEKFCANCGSPVSYPRVEVKESPAPPAETPAE